MTWENLKEFCNSLNEEQLKKQVIVKAKSRSIDNLDVQVLEENQYLYFTKVNDKGDPLLTELF